MQIHKYIIHSDEDIVGEDIVHGSIVIGHGYDLIVMICDDCRSEFEDKHKDSDLRYEGIYRSEKYCCHCKSYVSDKGPRVHKEQFSIGPQVEAVQQVQEVAQLVFGFVDNEQEHP